MITAKAAYAISLTISELIRNNPIKFTRDANSHIISFYAEKCDPPTLPLVNDEMAQSMHIVDDDGYFTNITVNDASKIDKSELAVGEILYAIERHIREFVAMPFEQAQRTLCVDNVFISQCRISHLTPEEIKRACKILKKLGYGLHEVSDISFTISW